MRMDEADQQLQGAGSVPERGQDPRLHPPDWQARFEQGNARILADHQRGSRVTQVAARRKYYAARGAVEAVAEAVISCVDLLYGFAAFAEPGRVSLTLGPSSYVLRCAGGPLDPWLQGLVDWHHADD